MLVCVYDGFAEIFIHADTVISSEKGLHLFNGEQEIKKDKGTYQIFENGIQVKHGLFGFTEEEKAKLGECSENEEQSAAL